MSVKKDTLCDDCGVHALDSAGIVCCQGLEKALAGIVRGQSFKTGDVIARAGDTPAGLFIIKKGLISLDIMNSAGTSLTVRIAKIGQLFGYRALFTDEPYYYTASALEPCEVCLIPKGELPNLMQKVPEFVIACLRQITSDLKTADLRWINQVSEDASIRIARTVLFLDENFQTKNWTRKEIGQLAGTTPETVIRTLSDFEKAKLIEQSGRRIEIKNRNALMNKADH